MTRSYTTQERRYGTTYDPPCYLQIDRQYLRLRQIRDPWVCDRIFIYGPAGLTTELSETMLNQDPHVLASVMFGRGKFQAGVLVEPKREFSFDPADTDLLSQFRNQIW